MKPVPSSEAANCPPEETQALLDDLVRLAVSLGASTAIPIDCRSIVVEDHLAALCAPPGCPNFGSAASCPPHVGGPPWFRALLAGFHWGIFFKIDLPIQAMTGSQRPAHFRQLHHIAARIEKAAVEWGCAHARAFAGGSCKELFCADVPTCDVVQDGKPCRHPNVARPSMSGFGINVFQLMETVGWLSRQPSGTDGAEDTSAIAGLVLVC
ncbi:Metal-binding protein-like protein [Desulfosarcina cetonica]|nr:Metal-binding protein-like protein [Desulfosarcina cetonica]